jgi:hypothetical protein
MSSSSSRLWLPQLSAAALLLGTLLDTPSGYYTLLRWVCCPVLAYLGLVAHAEDKDNWAGPMAIAALIYNPLFPLAMGHKIWIVVNLGVALFLLASILVLRKMPPNEYSHS